MHENARALFSASTRRLLLSWFCWGLASLSSQAFAQECLDCHEGKQPAASTAHAPVECKNCHPRHEEFPHPAEAETLGCETCHSLEADQTAQGVHSQQHQNDVDIGCTVCHGIAHEVELLGTTRFRRNTVETCGMCHAEEAGQFTASVHGKLLGSGGGREAPTCTTCHGEHAIQAAGSEESGLRGAGIRETCRACHEDLGLLSRFGMPRNRVLSFDASFHGLALQAGSQTVANCGSCHGYHDILPSSDSRSRIHADNLPHTCGSCHPGAGSHFALGPIHFLEGEGLVPLADFIADLYRHLLIPVVIGLMLLHNLGDWFRKVSARFRGLLPPPEIRMELRMLPWERIQHGLLIVSFVTLTWTGFALKFPDKFWAYPLVAWEQTWPVRGGIHRISAVIFLATAALHVGTLLCGAKLRQHWLELLPRWRDAREAMSGFAYNVGLRSGRPAISRHSYIEKAEYWAVVWGAALMSATGIMLWANNFFLAWLPKAAMDVATVVHYYEAVLAALAIVVWHFYFVIFDPNVYPLSPAWWTGYGRSKDVQQPAAAAASSAANTAGADAIETGVEPEEAEPDKTEAGLSRQGADDRPNKT